MGKKRQKHYSAIFFLFIGILFTISCSRPDERKGVVLAKAYGKYLYEDDIKNIIPAGTGARDSLIIVKNAINTWLKQQVILQKAEDNLPEEKEGIEKLIKKYKNSLTIYTYEDWYVKNNLDTLITESEIEKYYLDHKVNFELKEDIIKFFCVKLNSDSEHIGELKDIMESKNIHADSLINYCKANRLEYLIEDQNWVSFDRIQKIVSLQTYNHEAFLKNNRIVTVTDQSITYLVYFFDFRIKNGVSPLEFEKKRIISMILNSRKKKLLKKMRKIVFENALEKGDFEIY
ncbi:MAG: hypothetical protein ACEPOW_01820 [Bacteroidales bacterium]